jgi:hypothetical protein
MAVSRHSIDEVARQTGFSDRDHMRRAFLRAFGQPPQVLRRNARLESVEFEGATEQWPEAPVTLAKAAKLACVKRLVRGASDTPLALGLALERNLFLKLCVSDVGLARMRSYDSKKITSPDRSFAV